jgi:hypothetical protein
LASGRDRMTLGKDRELKKLGKEKVQCHNSILVFHAEIS